MLTARKGNGVEKQYNKRIINTKYRMGILRQKMRNEQNELNLYEEHVEKEKEKKTFAGRHRLYVNNR